MESYKCLICGNTDIHSIGYLNGKPYWRKCIAFNGENVKERKIKKGRFSLFELELKPGVDAKDLLIKKAGGSQPIGTNNVTSSIDVGKSKTLTHKSHPSSKSIKLKHKKKGKKNGINTLIKAVCESPKTRNT